MTEELLVAFVGLSAVQTAYYHIRVRYATRHIWLLGGFYFAVFLIANATHLLVEHFEISFYELPLLSLVLFLGGMECQRALPRFRRVFLGIPEFYLGSSLWAGFTWLGQFGQIGLWQGAMWSLFAAMLLPILAALKERLSLTDPPKWARGLPIYWVTVGVLLLGCLGFLQA